MSLRLKAYLAGPGVFLRDTDVFGQQKQAICQEFHLDGHYPTDNQLPIARLIKKIGSTKTALRISQNDERGMDGCDVYIGDLTPCFSGVSDLRHLYHEIGGRWSARSLRATFPGLQPAFDRYPGLVDLMVEHPKAGVLLTGQPDPGTVFELGYMVARNKAKRRGPRAFAYSNSPVDYFTRELIRNRGALPKRAKGYAADLVAENAEWLMVDKLDEALHGNLMLDAPILRGKSVGVHTATVDEVRMVLKKDADRMDAAYTFLGAFRRAVEEVASLHVR